MHAPQINMAAVFVFSGFTYQKPWENLTLCMKDVGDSIEETKLLEGFDLIFLTFYFIYLFICLLSP